MEKNSNFPTEVAVAIAEIRTQMTSVNNHIRESKDNFKTLIDKMDGFRNDQSDRDSEVTEKIHRLENQCNEKDTRTNWKLGFLFGLWAALEAIFKWKS